MTLPDYAIEAWRIATHLSAAKPPAIFLACADVAFEHLTPPDLAPGEVSWGPGFYGFRLREAKTEPMDPMEWIASGDAGEVWKEADETEVDQARKEGERNAERRVLLKLLRQRFGELPAAVVARVEAADVPELEAWTERIMMASRLEDVLGVMPS